MLYSQPAWNSLATPVSFFVTALLLGALAMGAAIVWNYGKVQKENPKCADVQCEMMRTTLRWIAIVGVVLLGIELIVLPIYLGFLATGNTAALTSLREMYSSYGLLFALRLILVFVGAGVFGLFLYQNASSAGQEKMLGNVAYSAFALVFVAELMGRYLFYVTQQGVGL
jgi:anaerobic dimethyl sulfoxide reductase subunit C (anchor subunit)